MEKYINSTTQASFCCLIHQWIHPSIINEKQNGTRICLQFPQTWQFFVPFLGWLSDPFKGLSDLQLGDAKGTLNHLELVFLHKSSNLQPQTTGSFFRIPHLQVLRQYTKYLAFALHHKWSTWNLPDFHAPVLRVPKTTPRTRRNRRNRRWRLHHPRSVARDLADRSID